MNRDHPHDELIDLGAATLETRGGSYQVLDIEGTLRPRAGIVDD